MCHGKPGQIIVIGCQKTRISIFDITQVPFHLVVPELKLNMRAEYFGYICYFDLPGVGDAIAFTDSMFDRTLCMYSLDREALLWTIGGLDEGRHLVKVADGYWSPLGVCSDNRGRLYVSDGFNDRIIVFSAASGSVLQVVQGRGHMELVKGRGIWVADPGITVYGPDIKYNDGNPEKGVASGSVLQEIKEHSLERHYDLCWHEETKSIIIHSDNVESCIISFFQMEY